MTQGRQAARAIRWIDRMNPADLPDDLLLRARLLTTFAACVVLWIPVLSAVLAWSGGQNTAIAVGVAGWTTGAAPWVMRRWRVVAGGNAAAASALATITAASLFNGGTDLQTHMVLAIVPVVAVATAGIRSAFAWAGVVLAVQVSLYALDAAGFPFPQEIRHGTLYLFQLAAACAFTTTLLGFVVMYEFTSGSLNRALTEREGELASIIATAPDGLLVLDGEGRIERANPAAERLFGPKAQQLVGGSIHRLFPAGLELHRTFVKDVAAHATDGRCFPSDVAIGRLDGVGNARFVVIVRDVTARHEAERAIAEARDRAVQASRAKSTFLANMSHELRTPLNAILGYAELIAEETADGDATSAPSDAARIISSGRHLMALINDVLDLSKIEAGKLVLDNQPMDVDTLVEAVASQVEPLLANRGNRLIRDIDAPLGAMVGDALRLKQILLNLLSNATKFTERGLVTLRARRCVDEPGREVVMFEVADTGIGMAPDQLDRIFEDFVQADASTTRKYGGTGLGLAISRRIVHMMGGKIGVWSQPGVGSTFTFQVPVQPGSLSPSTPVPLGVRGGVLVVDEDPWTRGALTRALRRAGMVVSMAATVDEAHDLAMRLQPKVMVVDVLRSRQKGWTLLERLRADPATASIPVAVLTMTTDRGLALALGATRLLESPVNREQVVDVVRELMPVTAGHALVIEDDDDLREILVRTLTRSGWTVAEARDGADGLDQLAIRDPDIIVLDLMMPNMDGFEFVTRLQSHPTCSDVPVLVVTARDLDDAELERLRGTVERVIHKGGQTRDQLLNEVLGIVRRQHTPQRELA